MKKISLLLFACSLLGCGDDDAPKDLGVDVGSLDAMRDSQGVDDVIDDAIDDVIDEPDGAPIDTAVDEILPPPEVRAFPGAEGHGAESIGGRGGVVVKVTNLNDSGPGSLRAALMMTVPRIIVFEVSGTIALESRIGLRAENSFFTVAGQTAPGDGIAIRNHALNFSQVEHGIIRHLRVRHGCPEGCAVSVADNINILDGTNNFILDHISMTWASDEVMGIIGADVDKVTLQNSLMAEGNTLCTDGDVQNLGPILGAHADHGRVTVTKNYIAHTCYRNYLQNAGQYEFINNLNYNVFSQNFSLSQDWFSGTEAITTDIVGHHTKHGPQTNSFRVIEVLRWQDSSSQTVENQPWAPVSLHIDDLWISQSSGEPGGALADPDFPYSIVLTRSLGTTEEPSWERRDVPMTPPKFPVVPWPAEMVPSIVLPTVGASAPKRDAVDARIVGDFEDLGEWEVANIRQYPTLLSSDVPMDSDDDGMPDDWENSQGLDPEDGGDQNGDIDNDGYTNIENYINSLVSSAP